MLLEGVYTGNCSPYSPTIIQPEVKLTFPPPWSSASYLDSLRPITSATVLFREDTFWSQMLNVNIKCSILTIINRTIKWNKKGQFIEVKQI